MKVSEEVQKMIEVLKQSGFTPVDAVFEGAVGVKQDTTLKYIDELNDKDLVSGVIRVIYSAGDDQFRFVEIPVGKGAPQDGQPPQA
ncbi:hypothetical protein AUJ14_05615 [Candidatus Micrarchaeota archaeon CG1_02_55_22]|nr:MAG: hypothetical protein AUJ14_05615 [Candidatus Micrarchaeota archaeon CG1_02_55_22]